MKQEATLARPLPHPPECSLQEISQEISPEISPEENEISDEEVDKIRQQIQAINRGIIVDIVDVKSIDDNSYSYTVRAKLMASNEMMPMPIFGDIKFKISKQAAEKLRRGIDK